MALLCKWHFFWKCNPNCFLYYFKQTEISRKKDNWFFKGLKVKKEQKSKKKKINDKKEENEEKKYNIFIERRPHYCTDKNDDKINLHKDEDNDGNNTTLNLNKNKDKDKNIGNVNDINDNKKTNNDKEVNVNKRNEQTPDNSNSININYLFFWIIEFKEFCWEKNNYLNLTLMMMIKLKI